MLQLIYYASLSGKLLLLNPPKKKAAFYFSKGMLVSGSLNNIKKQIGQRLIDSDAITPEQLEQCLAELMNEKHKKKLGTVLIEKGFLKTNLLHDMLKEQAKDAFFDAISWKAGSFAFISGPPSQDDDFTVNERIDHLLLEGLVQLDEISADSVPTALKN